MTSSILTQSQLKELIHYDADTGLFTRISSPYKHRIGVINTCANHRDGYFEIGLFGKTYKSHRLAWLYIHGCLPKDDIDHVNRDKLDNRLVNLREASRSQNKQNIGRQRNNTSGFKGVSYHKYNRKWRATIDIDDNRINLGYFSTPESASMAYEEAAKTLHAKFYYKNEANHG